MSLFHLLKPMNMNDGVKKMKNTPGAVLLDVRTPEEYKQVHIPGSMNIPLDQLETVNQKITDKNTPIFVHCLSGGRSAQAQRGLKHLGYTNVTNIGGIYQYNGETEKGES